MIFEAVGAPGTLEIMAEKCADLGRVSLEYSRKLRGEGVCERDLRDIRADMEAEMGTMEVMLEEISRSDLVEKQRINEEKLYKKLWITRHY
jgi:hypothetical protein